MEPSFDPDAPEEPLAPPSWVQKLLDPWCILQFFLNRWVRYVLAWMGAVAVLLPAFIFAWTSYNKGSRRDGNDGHVTVDFGAQYLMARMMMQIIRTREPHNLYSRAYQREVLEPLLPAEDSQPPAKEGTAGEPAEENKSTEPSDVESLLSWTMGSQDPNKADTAGPLYPPVHALIFSPLGLLPPRPAYRVMQILIFLLAVLDAWLISRISDGRLWWPVAIPLLVFFPGFNGTSCLAQNPQWTITFLLLGWWQLKEGHPWRGGIAWGFLAYKPVWAVSFMLVPLLTWRWRFMLSMMATGAVLCAATLLPLGWQCGKQSWLDWYEIGNVGSYEYSRQQNWIFLSRDLVGIPRRWMLTFKDRFAVNAEEWPAAARAGNILFWSVVGLTAAVVLVSLLERYRRRQVLAFTGPGAAFLLLGGYFACFHFMYYDTTVAVLPVALLFMEPRKYLEPVFLCWRPMSPVDRAYYQPMLDNLDGPDLPLESGWRPRWVVNPLPPLMLLLLVGLTPLYIKFAPGDPYYFFPPVDTFTLLAIWAWCGFQVVCGPYRLQFVRPEPAVPGVPDPAVSDDGAAGKAPAPWLMVPPWRAREA
jgi:hypothetical protein